MPWARTDWMSERVKFVAAYLEKRATFSDLCQDFGISRKTGYKWVHRYDSEGATALEERSRAPLSHPNATSDEAWSLVRTANGESISLGFQSGCWT